MWPSGVAFKADDVNRERFIDELVAEMSLAQKVGQMIQAEIRSVTPEEITQFHLGAILNGGGAFPENNKYAQVKDWVTLADAFYDASPVIGAQAQRVPILWGTDAVHGHNNVLGATVFPHNIGLGAANDPALIKRIAQATALEVAVTGIDWTFSPTLAVAQDIRWGRTYESYSSDPDIVSQYAKQMVLGLQGANPNNIGSRSILATAKHFVADGGTFIGDDQGNTLIDEADLVRIHGAPYFAALKAGVQTIMVSYSSINGHKMHGHRFLIQDVLKQRLGFDGFVISDWNGIGQVPGCNKAVCISAINAGIDMLMIPDRENWQVAIPQIIQAVNDGLIEQSRIDDAVRRILRVKYRYGLFAKPRPSERVVANQVESLGSESHQKLAREAVQKSAVLLKNNDALLPLSAKLRVAVVGEGAHSLPMQTGGWTLSWQGTGNVNQDFPTGSTLWQGIQKSVAQQGGQASYFKRLADVTGSFDVAIVVSGEQPYAEFHGDIQNERTLALHDAAPATLKAIKHFKQQNIPVATVVLAGRPLWATPEINASDAFVVAWLPGTEGAVIGEMLFDHSGLEFTGTLPFGWPSDPCDVNQAPIFERGYGMGLSDKKSLPHFLVAQRLTLRGCMADVPKAEKSVAVALQPELELFTGEITKAGSAALNGALSIDHSGAAVGIHWHGQSKEKLLFGRGVSSDMRSALKAEFDLLLDVNDIASSQGKVFVGMDCGPPCQAELDVADVLRIVAKHDAKGLAIPLSCFAENGVDFSKIHVPITLRVEGHWQVQITKAEIGLPAGEQYARYVCD